MFQAAVCEDEAVVLTHIRNSLAQEFNQRHISVAFDTFSESRSLLNMVEQHYHYDMIFMDIEMPELDGIEACRRIRETASDTLVVFISNKENLVFQSFEVQPFRFVRKTHFTETLPSLVDALSTELLRRSRQSVLFTERKSGDVFSFDPQRILYIEAQRKECCIVSETGITNINCTLTELEHLMERYDFIKVHRSYLVNCRFIFHIQKQVIVLANRQEIPMSRYRAEQVRKAFLEYSSGGLL